MSGNGERYGEAVLRRTTDGVQRSGAGVIDFFSGSDFVVGFDVGLVARCSAKVRLKVGRIFAEIVPKPGDFSMFVAAENRCGFRRASGDFVEMFVEGVYGAVGTRMGKRDVRHEHRCVNQRGEESNAQCASNTTMLEKGGRNVRERDPVGNLVSFSSRQPHLKVQVRSARHGFGVLECSSTVRASRFWCTRTFKYGRHVTVLVYSNVQVRSARYGFGVHERSSTVRTSRFWCTRTFKSGRRVENQPVSVSDSRLERRVLGRVASRNAATRFG